MKCPQCGNEIKLVSAQARPKGADYYYTCDSCGACLKWLARGMLKVRLKYFIAVIIFTFAADFLFFPGTVLSYFVIPISGVILFVVLLRDQFHLERCEEEEQKSPK